MMAYLPMGDVASDVLSDVVSDEGHPKRVIR
jgi:hypothetical protein